MKIEVPAGEGNRNQYMKMIMLQKCYQSWGESNQHNKLIWNKIQDSVGKKIHYPRGRLTTRLIKYTKGDPRELVKNFVSDRAVCGYKNAIALLQKQYGNLHTMLSSYGKEIKLMQPLKPGDAAAFQRLFNFLIKCQTMRVGSKYNPLDTPEMICIISVKLPLHLQDRWI